MPFKEVGEHRMIAFEYLLLAVVRKQVPADDIGKSYVCVSFRHFEPPVSIVSLTSKTVLQYISNTLAVLPAIIPCLSSTGFPLRHGGLACRS